MPKVGNSLNFVSVFNFVKILEKGHYLLFSSNVLIGLLFSKWSGSANTYTFLSQKEY